jgi:hypothetical protein
VRRRNHVVIDLSPAGSDRLTLAPGATHEISYVVMPILYEGDVEFGIGNLPIKLTEMYYPSGNYGAVREFSRPLQGIHDETLGYIDKNVARQMAIRRADYIIATNPRRLSSVLNPYGDYNNWYNRLLSDMAHLAYLKNGVLGYLEPYDKDVLDNLVEPGRRWYEAVNHSFHITDMGFLMIVGETEIVPSHYAGAGGFRTLISTDYAHYTDLYYANIAGQTARPELVVGRVIGDSLWQIARPIEYSVHVDLGKWDHEFNRAQAQTVSGRGEGVTSNFMPTVDVITDELRPEWFVDEIHWYYFNDETYVPAYISTMANKDVTFYRDHGNVDSWGKLGTGHTYTDTFTFYETHPLAFAAACLTGDYESDDDYNIAEAFLDQGAAVYIGSTELSEREANDVASKHFFRKWTADESIGQQLNSTKRYIWGQDGFWDHGKLWAFEYNLYGDPKYGATEPPLRYTQPAGTSRALNGTGLQFQEVLPMYQVTSIDGADRVEIPGGGLTLEGGYPIVPHYTISRELSAGEEVQDVRIIARGNETSAGGFNIPHFQPAQDCLGCDPLPPLDPATLNGWYPPLEQVYDWWVEEHADGTSTVEVKLYPFHVYSDTGATLYYQTYDIVIETAPSSVEALSLWAQESTVAEGETVVLDLVVENSAAAMDVYVQTTVRELASGDQVDGLPLAVLHDLSGVGYDEVSWDSTGFDAGQYLVVVQLMDTDNQVLDTISEEVTLGFVGMEAVSLSYQPSWLEPLDPVTLALTLENTGTVPLTGTGVIAIHPAGDISTTMVISAAFSNLAPAGQVTLEIAWAVPEGDSQEYVLVGYGRALSQVSSPVSEKLGLVRRTYLPLTLR